MFELFREVVDNDFDIISDVSCDGTPSLDSTSSFGDYVEINSNGEDSDADFDTFSLVSETPDREDTASPSFPTVVYETNTPPTTPTESQDDAAPSIPHWCPYCCCDCSNAFEEDDPYQDGWDENEYDTLLVRPEAYEVGFTSRRKRGGRKSLRVAGQQAGTSEGVVKKGKRGIGAGKRTAEEMEKVAEREGKMWKRGCRNGTPSLELELTASFGEDSVEIVANTEQAQVEYGT